MFLVLLVLALDRLLVLLDLLLDEVRLVLLGVLILFFIFLVLLTKVVDLIVNILLVELGLLSLLICPPDLLLVLFDQLLSVGLDPLLHGLDSLHHFAWVLWLWSRSLL